MANNRMIFLCNVCVPDDNWKYGDKGVQPIAKWYPAGGFMAGDDGAYYNIDGEQIQEFLNEHQHKDVASEHYSAGAGQENPIRLVYESEGKPILN